jgi:hydroxymethylbilane synthase
VDTRLGKVQRGEYDAVILACAGLDRLGMDKVISHRMSVEQMMPAPGQGALAVQCRDENAMIDLLAPLNHHETALCACAEREFLAALGGGCALPVAALATVRLRELHLRGRVVAADGSGQIDVEAGGPLEVSAAKEAGRQAAELAIIRGARELLRREATS